MFENAKISMRLKRLVRRFLITISTILALNIFLSLTKLENDEFFRRTRTSLLDEQSDHSAREAIENDDYDEFNSVFRMLFSQSTIQYCSETPSSLNGGRIRIKKPNLKFNAFENNSFFVKNLNYTLNNGRWTPAGCKARHRVAIIVPYKNRLQNLNYFLVNMHPFLQKQMLEYQIFIVEQSNNQM